MELSTKDKIVLSLLFAIFCYTGYLFFFASGTHNLNVGQNSIGKISSGNNSVRRKSQDGYVWEEVASPDKLYAEDLVYTGEKARAQLQLSQGVVLDMGEKTLVKLSEFDVNSETIIIQGKVEATVTGKQEFKFKIRNQLVTISPKTQRSKLEIDASKPEATVRQIEGEASVDKTEVTPTEEAKKEIAPPIEEKAPIEAAQVPVTPEPVIAPAPEPEPEPVKLPPAKLKAPSLPKNQNFEIKINQILEHSKNIARMPASEDEEFYVDLTWPEVEGAENYDLEIYGNAKGTELILKERVGSNKWRWDNPKLGKFFWKIAAVDSEGLVGESSPLEALFVNFNFKKNFVIKNFATSIERLRMRVSETPTVTWTWDKVPMATLYKVRLAYSSSFKNVFLEKNITDNEFTWDATEFSKENPDRAVFMDLVAVYKDSIFSPVEKDRFIVIEKGSYLIKKQIDSSYLVFNYAPSKSTYEISSGTISGESDHTIPVSFQINSGIQLNEKVFIFSALEYKAATFFSDSFSPGIDYQDIGFEAQYGRSLYNWRQFGFALSLGLRYNRLTEITATSATLLSGAEKSYATAIVNAFMDQILNDRWAHYAKVGLGAGNLTIINFEYNLKRTLKRSMFANIGAKYMYKSTGGTSDISITDKQIFLGLGWELPF